MKKSEENSKGSDMPTQGERNIWKFYEWAVVLAPIALMLSHWWIFYGFSQNTHEVMRYPEVNEPCIAWLYSIVYLYVPLMILPASYFFKWCNLFRIPFVYFLFINVERLYYGSWFCTNEMIDTYNPQNEMLSHRKTKCIFCKTKRMFFVVPQGGVYHKLK